MTFYLWYFINLHALVCSNLEIFNQNQFPLFNTFSNLTDHQNWFLKFHLKDLWFPFVLHFSLLHCKSHDYSYTVTSYLKKWFLYNYYHWFKPDQFKILLNFVFRAIVDICFENFLPNLLDSILEVWSSKFSQLWIFLLNILVSMKTWICYKYR